MVFPLRRIPCREEHLGFLDFVRISKQVFYKVPEIKLLIKEYGCVELLFLLEHEFVGHLSFAYDAFALEECTCVFLLCKLGLLLNSGHPTGLAASLPAQCSTRCALRLLAHLLTHVLITRHIKAGDLLHPGRAAPRAELPLEYPGARRLHH